MRSKSTQILVVGAGPAGLTAACELARSGRAVRIVDAAAGPVDTPRAILVWPPTLRILDGLGLGEPARAAGALLRRAVFYSAGRAVAPLDLTAGGAPLVLAQPVVEQLLRAALARHAVAVQYGARVTDVRQDIDSLSVRLSTPRGDETIEDAGWLLAADGMGSTIRRALGVPYAGLALPGAYVLGEGSLDGDIDRGAAHYYTGSAGIAGVIPLPGGLFRVSGAMPVAWGEPSVELIQRLLDERTPGRLSFSGPTWLTRFQTHRRLAATFRAGRVFLVGDAAHAIPPLGGQGLNLAMQDAHNLAWRLAAVASGRARAELLDGYDRERRSAARTAVRTAELSVRMWGAHAAAVRTVRDGAISALRAGGMLNRVYEPLYSAQRLRYPAGPEVAVSPAHLCALRARVLAVNGNGMRLSDRLNDAAYRGEGAAEQRMILLTVYASRTPELVRAAAKCAAEHPALVVHRDVPAEDLADRAGEPSAPHCRHPGYYLIRPDRIVAAHEHDLGLLTARSILASIATA